jgi:hypothetical protein
MKGILPQNHQSHARGESLRSSSVASSTPWSTVLLSEVGFLFFRIQEQWLVFPRGHALPHVTLMKICRHTD